MNNYKVYYHKISKELSGHKNDKYYIGITKKKYISDRWGKKGNGYKTQIFYRAIQKYGWDNIEHKILFEGLNHEDAITIEKMLIQALRTNCKDYGYNYTEGGDGVKKSENMKCHPVYCVELDRLFRTAELASIFTHDKHHTITNTCAGYCVGKTLKYTYCYIENMYKFYKKAKMSYSSRPVVDLSSGKLYGSCNIANICLNKHFYPRYTLSYKKYQQKSISGEIYKKNYLMYANDYVKMFDFTK